MSLSLAALFCYIANLHYLFYPSDLSGKIDTAVSLFGSTLAATAIFTFSLEYSQRFQRTLKYITLFFTGLAIVSQILYWIPEITILLIKHIQFLSIPPTYIFIFKINTIYRYSILGATVWLLVYFFISGRNKLFPSDISKYRLILMLLGPLIAFVTQGLLLLEIKWDWLDSLFLFSTNLSAVGLLYNSFQQITAPGALARRDSIVEEMRDGWFVTDNKNIVIDYNIAITEILDLPKDKLHGKSLFSLLHNYPNLIDIIKENREVELEKNVEVNDKHRYLNIRILNLQDISGNLTGRLLLWRDITNRKREEDAHHRARDEMFILLNALANAASQTTSLSDFLSEAIFQIVYPFRSQIVLIYLLEGRFIQKIGERYYLASHLGLSAEKSKMLSNLDSTLPLLEWIEKNRQYLLFDNPQDHRIPESMRELGMKHLIATPLLLQTEEGQRLLGVLFLGRKNNTPYNPDEIVRLTIIADQMANLIDSDRRRKLAITLSERQRLMRDIHDSVSQKLYGLVALTEAAQAAREAGSQLDYDQFLFRIGENARQAVKELRLFLFQMQPVDLEKEGIVSVLHHRLAAVEGRADIKARFVADETISLSKRKETALYFIAQEALNNVLRHAKAKSVSVTLKQGHKYVTLEITDDGCGFDKSNLDRGGLGLKNITERVKQENGKLKISSKPDEGTIIRVSFEKELTSKSEIYG